ncbi:TetR/AcrR family transcriptional regulator [Anaerocolumna sp. MB42-C2]|uniref:TetR/AcrR family transcriptional regulator n=1 Tax=Anaerocolumna sp. MB42-C2 TaxID=3070997 RepID=UPI0027E058D0|nr:TetR/AcrR family transcriptional regulator [Anaerocolumna sp. MB42-C2]WMJ89343.1 TetR/AcrR family transcriptional regulator [Anaerocolumna sp. MB42-C2]
MLQSINPTAKQSQRWIIKALLDLMEITEYDKISVSAICRRADLDRRTFYRNFDSKNDVLEEYIKILGEEYIKMYSAIDNLCSYTAVKFFFEFWSRHLSFIKKIKKCGLSDFIFQQFEKFTKEHIALLIGDNVLKLPIEYVFAYRIGGFWNAMLTWMAGDAKLSPDEMATIITQI